MSCLRPDRLALYLEGELSGPERREFEEHLAVCPACSRALEDRRALDLAFSSLPPIEVPPDFVTAVLARLPGRPRPVFGWLTAVVTGTAMLLAGLLGYHLITGESVVQVMLSVGRFILGFVSLAVPFVAKVFKVFQVFLKLAAELGASLVKGLGVLSSLLSPEAIGAALLLGLAMSLLLVFGVKKIASLGE
jgi:predicted anti-sigma-YlaC factor YlaD